MTMQTENGAVVLANASVLLTDDELAASVAGNLPSESEPAGVDDSRSELTITVDDFTITLVNNGAAVAADAKRYSVNGKATEWDAILLGMLARPKGAEMIVKAQVVVNKSTGMPAPRYATAKLKAARERMQPHHQTRITIERLAASVTGDGSVTYGAILVTVKPAAKR